MFKKTVFIVTPGGVTKPQEVNDTDMTQAAVKAACVATGALSAPVITGGGIGLAVGGTAYGISQTAVTIFGACLGALGHTLATK